MNVEPIDAPPRHAVLAVDGMVSSSHPAVSLVGARLLAEGANAVDASLAMAAMSWLALPGQCGVGGDAFAVVREPDGTVWTVVGSGFGPDGGSPEFYRENGLLAIPLDGPLAATVPGAIAAMGAMHAERATRSLPELWAPAIAAAEQGLPCTAKTRTDIVEFADALRRDAGARSVFLPDHEPPAVGSKLPQRQLAASLRLIAEDPASFYTGSLAERAVEALTVGGAPFSGEEWALGWPVAPEPSISGNYRGAVVHQTPLPTPGWMVLQQAALCDGQVSSLPWLSAEAVHWLAAAARIAFADRWRSCGSDTDAWRGLLCEEAIAAGRRRISTPSATSAHIVAVDADTTSTVAVDRDGRAVSFIHSLGFTFGARWTINGTGIVLNNRLGRGAYLVEGHPNQVRPRRRPLHTLNAWVVTDERGELRHVGNTPGGDGQVQWNMQLLSHLLDHGLDPQAAVTAPRFTVFPGSDANTIGQAEELRCESRLGAATIERLRELGQTVRVTGPWDGGGSAQIISVDAVHGCLLGGADPRLDGVALGL